MPHAYGVRVPGFTLTRLGVKRAIAEHDLVATLRTKEPSSVTQDVELALRHLGDERLVRVSELTQAQLVRLCQRGGLPCKKSGVKGELRATIESAVTSKTDAREEEKGTDSDNEDDDGYRTYTLDCIKVHESEGRSSSSVVVVLSDKKQGLHIVRHETNAYLPNARIAAVQEARRDAERLGFRLVKQ